jgi:hypothetical protein
MNTASCECRRVEPAYENLKKPGDFYIKEQDGKAFISIVLPDGTFNHLPIYRGQKERTPSWKWNGDLDKPTLEPSIHCIDHWHGFLRCGRLESC